VISAGGIKRAFPKVTGLAAAAPALSRWIITAFRPRRRHLGVVKLQGRQVDPRDVKVSLLDNGVAVGIYLFLPDFREPHLLLKLMGYLLLDDALGEFDVESKLSLIKMLPRDAQTNGERFPLPDLAPKFDQLIRPLENARK
jgi:hypothetical protein